MLTPRHLSMPDRARQSGVVLIITLIVLVAMTLAAISLMRSVDTTNIIAGNLAFRQSATQAADAGTEDAITVLLPSLFATGQLGIQSCPNGFGYKSFYEPNLDPPVAANWDAFWKSLGNCPKTLAQDAAGNTIDAGGNIVALNSTIQYVVQSMCAANGQGQPCATAPPTRLRGAACSSGGGALGDSEQTCLGPVRMYYRITTRVQGPRNSVSYIQTIVAM